MAQKKTSGGRSRKTTAAGAGWTAVVDANGNLVSVGTVIADAATLQAAGLSTVALPSAPDMANSVWDSTQKAFVAAQQIDRIQEFISNHQAFWNALSAAQQTSLQNALTTLIGTRRFRRQDEQANL